MGSPLAPYAMCVAILGCAPHEGGAPEDLMIRSLTASSLDISPDGRTLALDVLGDIYLLPVEGGQARLFLGGAGYDTEPRFSPDGRYLAFSSDRVGQKNLWVADLGNGEITQVSNERGQGVTQPEWAGPGHLTGIHARVDDALYQAQYEYLQFSLASGAVGQLSDGWRTAPVVGQVSESYERIVELRDGVVVPTGVDGHRPHVSPDGRNLAYVVLKDGRASLWARQVDGSDARRLVDLGYRFNNFIGLSHYIKTDGRVEGLPDFGIAQDGGIYAIVDGRPARIDPGTGAVAFIPFELKMARPEHRLPYRQDAQPENLHQLRWTSFAERSVAFVAGGDVWIQLDGDRPERVTNAPRLHQSTALSADGAKLAYSDWSDEGGARLVVRDLHTADERVVRRSHGPIINIAWAPDGETLAYLELRDPELERQGFWRGGALAVLRLSDGESTELVDRVALNERALIRPYTPVSFSPDSRSVTYQVSFLDESGWGQELRSVSLAGGEPSVLWRFSNSAAEQCGLGRIDHFVPSAGKWMGIVDRTDLWIATREEWEACGAGDAVHARRVSPAGANYVQWTSPDTVGFSLGQSLYRARLDADGAAEVVRQSVVIPVSRPTGGDVALTNARILTMDGQNTVIENGSIIIRGGRIASVGAVPIPSDLPRRDLAGRVVMPGQFDVHSDDFQRSREVSTQSGGIGEDLLRTGVTSMLVPSGRTTTDLVARGELVDSGRVVGPRLYTTGTHLQSLEDQPTYVRIESLEDARRIVDQQVDNGAMMIKIYLQRRRDQRQWLIQAARERGVEATTDVSAGVLEFQMTHLMDGALLLEHGFTVSPLRDDVLLYAGAVGAFVTPTALDVGISDGGRALFDEPLRDEIDVLARAEQGLNDALPVSQAIAEHFPFSQIGDYNALIEYGVSVSIGRHGGSAAGHLQEMGLLALSGMTLEDVLRSATIEGARKLGLDNELGSIEVGKIADLIVVDGDPRLDLRALEHVDSVYVSGRLEVERGNLVFPAE